MDNAIYCREKALEELSKFVVDNDKKETFLFMRADLLRRTGQFDLLIKEYEGKVFSEKLLNRIAAFHVKKARHKSVLLFLISKLDEEPKF